MLADTTPIQKHEHARPWPSPHPNTDSWSTELASRLGETQLAGNIFQISKDFSSRNAQGSVQDTPAINQERLLFNELKSFPNLRKSLASVNLAKSYEYGSKTFGKKSWYREDFDVGRTLRENQDRRAFRFGLKSNVDFLIQLDLENLRACLLEKKTLSTHIPSSELHPKIPDGSFFSLMKTMDNTKFGRFCSIFNRLISNVNFTQSLSEYFATDDMLEPALSVIAEAIRSGPDLGSILRGGSFSASSLTYRNRASYSDHDQSPKTYRSSRSSQNVRSSNNSRRSSSKIKSEYKFGYCFDFQEFGICKRSKCKYFHQCCICDSFAHGQTSCDK